MNLKKKIPQELKNIYHLSKAVAANIIFAFPSRKIKVIGVTGTNGKTTTVQMITKILEKAGHKVAMASTINFKIGENEWTNKTKFTTLSSFSIQKFINRATREKCDFLVLETSSHALHQSRVWGVEYDTAVITNVTREHLDYHKNMDEYRLAKLKMFLQAKTIVVNLDMEIPKDFLVYGAKNKFGYTTKRQESVSSEQESMIREQEVEVIRAEDIQLNIDKSLFSVPGLRQGSGVVKQNSQFTIHLPGLFNVENALAAITTAKYYGIKPEIIAAALDEIKGVPGRMEYVPNDRNLKIIIDYALTPDSMEKLGELITGIKNSANKLIWVFGSCGDRDRGKRPIMGEIVARYADYVIVTNEDPYGENPQQIIDEVFNGVISDKSEIRNPKFETNLKSPAFAEATAWQNKIQNSKEMPDAKYQILNTKTEGKNCWRILDRREAISVALKLAEEGDIVLVTGKGAEETMRIGDKIIPWNDRKVMQEILSD